MTNPEATTPQPDPVSIGFYAVAFLDLLGFRNELMALDDLPDKDDPKATAEFFNKVTRTFGTINSMQISVAKFFDVYSKRSPTTFQLPGLTALFRQTQLPPVKFQRFSDGLVLFVPLARSDAASAQHGIYALLGACATHIMISLAAGRPIRGGIDVGLGMELNENEIYGAAVAKAYELEHEVAQLPRIVIGNSLVEFLKASANLHPVDNRDRVNQSLAKVSLSMLCSDVDGRLILDYLGVPFKRHVAAATLTPLVVTKAHEFVVAQYEHWAREQNTKLAVRYALLREYFKARINVWTETSS